MMYALYHDCDPITTQQVDKKDQLFPLFVMQVMGDYPGVPGTLSSVVMEGHTDRQTNRRSELQNRCAIFRFFRSCEILYFMENYRLAANWYRKCS